MDIAEGIEVHGLALYLPKERALILADFHLGIEGALCARGFFIPRTQAKETAKKLNAIFSELKRQNKRVNQIIINGDLKHEFGAASEQEWQDAFNLIELLRKHSKCIVVVKGNHDVSIRLIAKKYGLEVVDSLELGATIICHGDKLFTPKLETKAIIIGHEHPAVTISDGIRSEKVKCFLKGTLALHGKAKGKWKNRALVVMPSFCTVAEGTDVARGELLSPFLKRGIEEFEVIVCADKPRNFGKLRDLG